MKWDLSSQQSVPLIWNLTCLPLYWFSLNSVCCNPSWGALGQIPLVITFCLLIFKKITVFVFLVWDMHVIRCLIGFNVNKNACVSLCFSTFTGHAGSTKWAFFTYSGLLTASVAPLTVGLVTIRNIWRRRFFLSAGVDISNWDDAFSSAATARKLVERCIAKQAILQHINCFVNRHNLKEISKEIGIILLQYCGVSFWLKKKSRGKNLVLVEGES